MLYHPSERGQGLVEYAFILVLVSLMTIAIVSLMGPQFANIFSGVLSKL